MHHPVSRCCPVGGDGLSHCRFPNNLTSEKKEGFVLFCCALIVVVVYGRRWALVEGSDGSSAAEPPEDCVCPALQAPQGRGDTETHHGDTKVRPGRRVCGQSQDATSELRLQEQEESHGRAVLPPSPGRWRDGGQICWVDTDGGDAGASSYFFFFFRTWDLENYRVLFTETSWTSGTFSWVWSLSWQGVRRSPQTFTRPWLWVSGSLNHTVNIWRTPSSCCVTIDIDSLPYSVI